jgi:hypothetical protein
VHKRARLPAAPRRGGTRAPRLSTCCWTRTSRRRCRRARFRYTSRTRSPKTHMARRIRHSHSTRTSCPNRRSSSSLQKPRGSRNGCTVARRCRLDWRRSATAGCCRSENFRTPETTQSAHIYSMAPRTTPPRHRDDWRCRRSRSSRRARHPPSFGRLVFSTCLGRRQAQVARERLMAYSLLLPSTFTSSGLLSASSRRLESG